jgi:biopolymer transport protein ExbD
MKLELKSLPEAEFLLEMNATPLIDIMMVLLIMLIVTIPVQLHSIDLHMPQSSSAKPPAPPVIIRVDIDSNNVIHWNGKTLQDANDMEQMIQASAFITPQPEIHIRADAKAKYGTVARVMASVQKNGLKKLGIVE